MITTILQPILDLLFPEQCVVCGVYDTVLCTDCIHPAMGIEHLVFPDDSAIASITTLGEYAQPAWKRSIKAIKFSSVHAVAEIHGALLAGALAQTVVPLLNDEPVIIPIPLHAKRLRERGYNQTALIAHVLAQHTGWHMDEKVLKRQAYAKAQSSVEHEMRSANIAGSYAVNGSAVEQLAGKPILLLDDVITTGATILEAASTIQQYTKTTIHVVAVARGT